MPHLLIVSPKVALEMNFDRAITIGRHIANSLPIPDAEISRRHAQIFPKDDAFFISDLGSRNGVFVNGEKVTEQQELKSGDEIALGMSLCFFNPPDVELIDQLSNRGALLWNKLPHDPEFASYQITTSSLGELAEMLGPWLDKGVTPASLSPGIIGHLLEYALTTDQWSDCGQLALGTLEALQARIGGERLAIMTLVPKSRKLEAQALIAPDTENFEISRDILRIVVDGERAVYCPDCSCDFRFSRLLKQADAAMGSFLAAPIFLKDKYYGFIYADQPASAPPFQFKHMMHAYLAGALYARSLHWHNIGRSHQDED